MKNMKNITKNEARNINGGWNRCAICGQYVSGNWWAKYKHCLGHSSRCLPWSDIMAIAFGIFL